MQKYSFRDNYLPLPAARHINPDRSLGGWVAASAHVAPTAHIDRNALVYDLAKVVDQARVYSSL